MSMSKKDFIALADELRPLFGPDSPDDGFQKDEIVGALCRFMARSNSQFKESRWRDYLAGKVGPTQKSAPGPTQKSAPGFMLEIETGNDAFSSGNKGPEIARILRKVAAIVEADGRADRRRVLDINGNSVGRWGVI